jgi:hypothetical protein
MKQVHTKKVVKLPLFDDPFIEAVKNKQECPTASVVAVHCPLRLLDVVASPSLLTTHWKNSQRP